MLVIRQSALATQPMFGSCMPFVPVCVQGFNNNTNQLALAVEFAHAMHQHTHAPHRLCPAGPTALGSGGGGAGGDGRLAHWCSWVGGWPIGAMCGGGLGWKGGRKWPRVFIAAPAKEICGDVKKATPHTDCPLTYPPVFVAAPAKKKGGELKTPPAIPTACQPTCPCAVRISQGR